MVISWTDFRSNGVVYRWWASNTAYLRFYKFYEKSKKMGFNKRAFVEWNVYRRHNKKNNFQNFKMLDRRFCPPTIQCNSTVYSANAGLFKYTNFHNRCFMLCDYVLYMPFNWFDVVRWINVISWSTSCKYKRAL